MYMCVYSCVLCVCVYSVVLEIVPRALGMLGKDSVTELHTSPALVLVCFVWKKSLKTKAKNIMSFLHVHICQSFP